MIQRAGQRMKDGPLFSACWMFLTAGPLCVEINDVIPHTATTTILKVEPGLFEDPGRPIGSMSKWRPVAKSELTCCCCCCSIPSWSVSHYSMTTPKFCWLGHHHGEWIDRGRLLSTCIFPAAMEHVVLCGCLQECLLRCLDRIKRAVCV